MNRHQLSYSGVMILLLLISLIAINVIFYFIPLRWDVTEEKVFTISPGTRKIVEGLEDKVTIKFYFSKSNEEIPPQFKTYAQRVEELLGEYKNISKMLEIESYDPKPDSEEEEWAQKYGVNPVNLPSGSPVYFGMVGLSVDREVNIPFFDPRREEFLEYDISQALYKLSTPHLTKIGILSSMDLMGNTPAFMRGQSESSKWVVVSELEKNFEVKNIPVTTEEIADDIKILLVIHPKSFSERLQYAIDQYVLRGGRVVVMVDPFSREDARNAPPNGQFGQMPANNSELPKLFQTWGIEMESGKLIGDFTYATPVNSGNGAVIRFPLWMTMNPEALDNTHPVTSQLENVFFVESGALKKIKDADVEWTPLIQTTTDSGLVDAFMMRFSGPEQILKTLKPDQTQKTVAGLVRGTFETAFPAGQPAREAQEGDAETPAPALTHPHLNKAKEANTILIVSDVDFISDAFSVQKMGFLGQVIIQPTNDNLNFAMNAVEFLSGNEALMSIRSRGRFTRPFTTLIEIQQKAMFRYQEEEAMLQQKLDEVREKLQALQDQAGKQRKLLLTPELQKEIEQFREEELKTKKRLREVRKILRQDIESLGNWLMVLNMLAIPTLVALIGIGFFIKRMRKRQKI
ncbi:MAG: Gldg family protein [SAR324 cluster bacterium]|nr:Gldg family protein [SAR324 cluster bacterium]